MRCRCLLAYLFYQLGSTVHPALFFFLFVWCFAGESPQRCIFWEKMTQFIVVNTLAWELFSPHVPHIYLGMRLLLASSLCVAECRGTQTAGSSAGLRPAIINLLRIPGTWNWWSFSPAFKSHFESLKRWRVRTSDVSISENLIRTFQVGSRAWEGGTTEHFGILSSYFEALPMHKRFFDHVLIVVKIKLDSSSTLQGCSLKPVFAPAMFPLLSFFFFFANGARGCHPPAGSGTWNTARVSTSESRDVWALKFA